MAPNAFSDAPMDVADDTSSVTPPAGSQAALAAVLGTFLELVERIAVAAERIADAEEETVLALSEEPLPNEGAETAPVSGNAE